MPFRRVAIAACAAFLLASMPSVAVAQQEPVPQDDEPVIGRVVLEFFGGLAGGTAGLLTGWLFGTLTCGDDFDCEDTYVWAAAVGTVFALPLGTMLGGDLGGGNGSYGAAFLGEVLGWVASILPAIWVVDTRNEGPEGVTLILAFPIGGAMVGYEMSHDPDEDEND